MKKFILFLVCLIMLIALFYVSAGIYVCDYGSTIKLKSIGIESTCKCLHGNKYVNITCEKNQ